MEICKQQSEIKKILERFVCFRVGVAKHFLDQSIGIDETNTIQLKFFI